MTQSQELSTIAKSIIDSNLYLVLGTAYKTKLPWASPRFHLCLPKDTPYDLLGKSRSVQVSGRCAARCRQAGFVAPLAHGLCVAP